MANNEAGHLLVDMGGDETGQEPSIPAVSVAAEAGAALRCAADTLLGSHPPCSASLARRGRLRPWLRQRWPLPLAAAGGSRTAC